MIVTGAAMQIANMPGLMASSLSSLQTSGTVIRNLQHSDKMKCVLDTSDEKNRSMRYTVEWSAGGETGVQIEGPEGTRFRTFYLAEQEVSMADLQGREVSTQPSDSIDDPIYRPVLNFLTPSALARFLAGRWREKDRPLPHLSNNAIFLLDLPERSLLLELTIDLRSYYPAELRILTIDREKDPDSHTERARARFRWEPREASGSFLNFQSNLL
jgi:hypothetical protein